MASQPSVAQAAVLLHVVQFFPLKHAGVASAASLGSAALSPFGDQLETEELYTSQLLARSAADPSQAAAFVAFDTTGRIEHFKQHILQIGVYLPKYNNSNGVAKQRVHDAVDQIFQGIMTWNVLDPKRHTCATFLNFDTMQQEPCPQGLCKHAAEVRDRAVPDEVV
eukprot:gene5478-5713_t